MPRYIDANKLKERTMMIGLEQGKMEFAVFLCKYIDTEPTAEVAMEIFEEFESILDAMIQLNHAIGVQQEDPIEREKAISAEQALRAFCDYVAELKKKYTEVE